MLTNDSPYQEQFHQLLEQIREVIRDLDSDIKTLKKENQQLRSKLEEIQNGQTDIYAAMTESERIALRQQISGLISKIDTHLEE